MGRLVIIEIGEDGNKSIHEIITPDGWQVCLTCRGDGTVEDDFGEWGELPCPECDGEGMIEE